MAEEDPDDTLLVSDTVAAWVRVPVGSLSAPAAAALEFLAAAPLTVAGRLFPDAGDLVAAGDGSDFR